MPVLEHLNYGHKFLVIDFIVTFRCVHCLGPVRDWIPQTVVTFLREYLTDGEVGCVYLNFGQVVRIIQCQNGCFCECLFERSKGCFLIFSPVPGCVLFCEVVKQICFSREVLDESAVEVREAEESPNIMKVARLGPIGDSSGLFMIYAYMTGFNNHADVLDVVTIELAFLGFQIKVIFL